MKLEFSSRECIHYIEAKPEDGRDCLTVRERWSVGCKLLLMSLNRKFGSFKKAGVSESGIKWNRSHRKARGLWISRKTRSDSQLHLEAEQLLFSITSLCPPRIVSSFHEIEFNGECIFIQLLALKFCRVISFCIFMRFTVVFEFFFQFINFFSLFYYLFFLEIGFYGKCFYVTFC